MPPESIIDPNNLPADNPSATDPNPADNPAGDNPAADPDKKLDPFGDLVEFKDEASGLYLGKYKTITDVFRGYKELSGKVREKSPEAPENYEVVKLDGDDLPQEYRGLEIKTDDPMFAHFVPAFKEAKLTQEQVAILAKHNVKYGLSAVPDLEAERKKLGGEADKIITEVGGYLKKRGTEAMSKLAEMAGRDGEMLKELHLLIAQGGEKTIPVKTDSAPLKSHAELSAEALEYKKKYQKEMDNGNKYHQEQYYALLTKAQRAKQPA